KKSENIISMLINHSICPDHTSNHGFIYDMPKKTESPFLSIEIIDSNTDANVKNKLINALSSTLDSWGNIIDNRLKNSENKYFNNTIFLNDQRITASYHDLIKLINRLVDRFLTAEESKESSVMMVVVDSDARIQAIAALQETAENIKPKVLILAPWNVMMWGENSKEHKKLCVQVAEIAL